MIVARDNVLPDSLFKNLQKYCNDTPFKIIKAGEKEFLTIPTPENIIEQIQVEGHKIILSFIRQAHQHFDIQPRIHADGIINGKKTVLASVLYINSSKGVTPNGTAFFEHFRYGHKLPENITNKEFDRLITEESNQLENFTMTDKIMARPNRLLLYDASFFHSKWPQKISQGKRIVLVTFYSKFPS